MTQKTRRVIRDDLKAAQNILSKLEVPKYRGESASLRYRQRNLAYREIMRDLFWIIDATRQGKSVKPRPLPPASAVTKRLQSLIDGIDDFLGNGDDASIIAAALLRKPSADILFSGMKTRRFLAAIRDRASSVVVDIYADVARDRNPGEPKKYGLAGSGSRGTSGFLWLDCFLFHFVPVAMQHGIDLTVNETSTHKPQGKLADALRVAGSHLGFIEDNNSDTLPTSGPLTRKIETEKMRFLSSVR